MRNNITAVMIVKDEEANLERCLTSVKLITDKIVIVDTGSTDKTMEIADDFGANVYEHPWNDSFSEARNHALQYIETEWAFQMDADEEVAQATIPEMEKLDGKYDAYATPIHNVMPCGSMTLHHFERIYRPAKVHYIWHVHNELKYDGDSGVTAFSILHHGYSLSDEEMKKKYTNTLRLLMMDIEDAGYVTRNVRYLIQTYRALERHADVLDVIDKHGHKLADFPGQHQDALAGAVVAHNALDDNTKAKVAGIQLLQKYPDALDALFYLGICNMQDQAWSIAMGYFSRYLAVRNDLQMERCASDVVYHTWGNRAQAFQNMAFCAAMNGNKAQCALFSMRAEMLASHRTDYPAFAANTDQALCLLLDTEQDKAGPREITKLTKPDEPKSAPIAVALPSIKGSGEGITKE